MLIINNYGSMRNTNKTVIHILKLMAGQYLFLFHISWLLFKSFTDLQKVVEMKENYVLAKTPKC